MEESRESRKRQDEYLTAMSLMKGMKAKGINDSLIGENFDIDPQGEVKSPGVFTRTAARGFLCKNGEIRRVTGFAVEYRKYSV